MSYSAFLCSNPFFPTLTRSALTPVGDGDPAEEEDGAGEGAVHGQHRRVRGADGREETPGGEDGRLPVGCRQHPVVSEQDHGVRATGRRRDTGRQPQGRRLPVTGRVSFIGRVWLHDLTDKHLSLPGHIKYSH